MLTLLTQNAQSILGMPAAVSQNASGVLQGLMMPVLLAGALGFMIFTQRKKEKKAKTMLAEIKEGDKIRTIGGFYGKVIKVKEDIFVIECGPDKVKLEIIKSAVSTVSSSEVENESLSEKK